MKENIEKLQQHYSEFDLIWNNFPAIGEIHRLIRNTEQGKVLLQELSDWYVKGQNIITDMKEEHERV